MLTERKVDVVGVGVAIILMREIEEAKEVLLGRRRGSHGAGTWSFPGGKIEHFELAKQRGLIELLEETGLTEKNVKLIDEHPYALTEDLFPKGLHYITLYLRARYINGSPRVMEPKKCEGWVWCKWENLKNMYLFLPIKNLLKQNYNPFSK